jgi:outer membrane receptor for ferric coprogen and ferric-rhodotorulic acid
MNPILPPGGRRFAWAVFPSLAAALSLPLAAQTAATSPTAKPEPETFVLSPFQVHSEDDQGYIATNTLAGSRLNTSLFDTPASISVMTKDFLDDLGALNVNQAMEFALSAGNDIGGGNSNVGASTGNGLIENDFNFQIRGYRRATQTRDYFNTLISGDVFNLDRIDIARGPNSILFGIGGPGGIVNVSPKRARFDRNTEEVTLHFGSWNLRRGAIDVNRELIDDKLAARINLMEQRADGYRDFESDDQERGALALTWNPTKSTTVRFSGELGHMKQNKVRPWMPWDQISQWAANGRYFVEFGTPQAPSVLGDKNYAQFQSGNNNGFPAGPSDPFYGSEIKTAGHIVNGTGRIYLTDGPLAGKVLYTGTSAENARFYRSSSGASVSGYNSPTAWEDESVYPRTGNITGPGQFVENDYYTVGLFLEQRIGQNLFIEAAVNRSKVDRLNRQVVGFGGISIMYDVTTTLPTFTNDMRYNATVGGPNGQAFATKLGIPYVATTQGQNALNLNSPVRNPYAGELLAYAEPTYSETETVRDDMRVSANYNLDLDRFGKHMLLGFVSRTETPYEMQNYREGNVHPQRLSQNHFTDLPRRVSHILPFSPNLAERGLPDPFATKIGPTQLYGRPDEWFESGFVRDDWRKSLTRIDSAALAAHSNFFNGHLVTTAGVRRDRIKVWTHTNVRNATTSEMTGINPRPATPGLDQTGDTHTLGAVFRIPKAEWIGVFANRSTNFQDQGGQALWEDEALRAGRTLGPLEGKGLDYGVKLSLLDNRLNATITRFTVDLDNQASGHQSDVNNYINAIWTTILNGGPNTVVTDQNDPNGHRVGGTDTRSQKSEGYELEITANVTHNWRVSFNISKAENKISQLGGALTDYVEKHRSTWQQKAGLNYDTTRPPGNLTNSGGTNNIGALITGLDNWLTFVKSQEGQIETNIRPWNANLFTAYRFSEGRLKGLTLGGGANYRGDAILGVKPATLQNPVNEVFKGRDYFNYTAMLGYEFKIQRDIRVRLQLNVDNLFDNDDKQVVASAWNPVINGLQTYDAIPLPRSYRLSATFSF